MNYSFIIPVYNCKNYLPACIESLRAAGLEDFEILLVDDGSTDGSGAVCDELAGKYPQVRAIHQPNGGVSAARNRGIREAKGGYILFVDADDRLLPFDGQTLEYLGNDRVDMLMFGMKFQYCHKGAQVREEILSYPCGGVFGRTALAENFSGLFYANYFAPVWNKFIKRSILTEHQICFDERLINYEDLAFSLQVLAKCSKIATVPQAYYCYRLDYDHDHTIDRIARIDDVMGNTDIIAERFFDLEQALQLRGEKVKEIRKCLLGIYLELFGMKIKTTPLSGIGRYCRDFCGDSYVHECIEYLPEMSDHCRRMHGWISENCSLRIWCHSRYIMLRHWAARNVKRIIRRWRA